VPELWCGCACFPGAQEKIGAAPKAPRSCGKSPEAHLSARFSSGIQESSALRLDQAQVEQLRLTPAATARASISLPSEQGNARARLPFTRTEILRRRW